MPQMLATILRDAAQRVRRGWCQAEGLTKDGRVCAFAGIALSVTWGRLGPLSDAELEAIEGARVALLRALGLPNLGLGGWSVVYDWNDAPQQTAEGVALGLEYAALLAEQESGAAVRDPESECVA